MWNLQWRESKKQTRRWALTLQLTLKNQGKALPLNAEPFLNEETRNRCSDWAFNWEHAMVREDRIMVTKEAFQKGCLWIQRLSVYTVCPDQTYNCWAYVYSGQLNQLWASWGKATCLGFTSFVFASYKSVTLGKWLFWLLCKKMTILPSPRNWENSGGICL